MAVLRVNRKAVAEASFWLGVAMLIGAVLSGYHYGIAIGAFIPLPFTLAAMLNRVGFSIALALASWGCWFTALGFILA